MAELAQTEAFQLQLGRFYAAWLSNEFMMDYAIGRLLLNISHEQTHILTSGMEFGRKVRLLINGWKDTSDPKKKAVIGVLNYFEGQSKRNIFAHSFLISSAKAVVFVERSHSRNYFVKEHSFDIDAFTAHVQDFVEKARLFREHLDIDVTSQDFRTFRAAALSLINNDSKSHK